jgi:hypothetical protein
MQLAVREALEASGTAVPSPRATATLERPVLPLRTLIRSDRDAVAATTSMHSRWTTEHQSRTVAIAKLRVTVEDLMQRFQSAKKRSADAQSRVAAARAQRNALDEWFNRRVGTRTAAVEEARRDVRRQTVAVARRALLDRETFGAASDPLRDRIASLERAAQAAARDVELHQTALDVPDARAFRSGITVLVLAGLLVLLLVTVPVVWRAARVIDPPPPKVTQPAH